MKVDNYIAGNNLSTDVSSTMLKRVTKGDILRVRILEVSSNELLLRLPDGTVFNAISELPINASLDDYVTFVVSNKTNDQIFLETINKVKIASDIVSNENLLKELNNLNIEATDDNMKIAYKLKSYDFHVTPDSLNEIAGLLSEFKNLDLAGALFLYKSNISAEKVDVDSLEKLLSDKLKISDRLESLNAILNNILDENILEKSETLEISDGKTASKTAEVRAKDFFSDLFPKIDLDGLKNGPLSENLIKNIYERLEAIKNSIVSFTNKKNQIIEHIESIKKDIEFINKVGRHNVYLQIPIILNEHKTTGELYVLKRKSSSKKSGGNSISVFISLNTNYLGKVDSLLTLKGTAVSIDIKVENQQFFKVIKKNYKLLFDNLRKKGYNLVDFKYGLTDDKINLANVEEYILKELKSKIYTLDCRV